MKMTVFHYADSYIDSVEAFCNTVNVTDLFWHEDAVIVAYE